MTRESKREIEQRIAALTDTDSPDHPAVVYKDPETGDYIDMYGNTVDRDERPIRAVIPTDEQIESRLQNNA